MAEEEKQKILQSLNEIAAEKETYICRRILDSAHFVRALNRALGLEQRR